MSKKHFELDAQAKKVLADKHKRPAAFAKSTTTVETTTAAPQEEASEEYPLNHE
jgi:hypothetical protein